MPKARLTREQIAERAALELPDGAYVNLGWGIPNLDCGVRSKRCGGLFSQRKWNSGDGAAR